MQITPSTESGIVIILVVVNLCQLAIQIADKFFSSKTTNKDLLIENLQERMIKIEKELKDEKESKKVMADQIFDLTKENAYLRGLVESLKNQQSIKESLVNRKINK